MKSSRESSGLFKYMGIYDVLFIPIYDHLLSLGLRIPLPHQIHCSCHWLSSPYTWHAVSSSHVDVLLGPLATSLEADVPWVIHMCENVPCLHSALLVPQPPWMYLAEGLVHHTEMERAVPTTPSKAGVHIALFHLGKGGDTHSLWETVSTEAGVNQLFNNKQAQCLLFYYFYAYGTCTHSISWDYCLRLPPKSCKNRSPLNSCWFCCMF